MKLLLIDDEKGWSENIRVELKQLGIEVFYEEQAENALKVISTVRPDAVLLDIMFDGVNKGKKAFGDIKKKWPDLPVIILTSTMVDTYADADYPGRAFPYPKDALRPADERTYEIFATKIRAAVDKIFAIEKYDFGFVVGHTEKMRKVCSDILKSANSGSSVLITGGEGTGKELAARAIHDLCRDQGRPFVEVNCGAISESLIESELFGICKGGATNVLEREGFFERANGGTIFLDEIGNMTLAHQASLLRVLQDKKFSRVGASRNCRCVNKTHPSHTDIQVNVRVIAATNIDLETAIKNKRFRSDLFERLNVIHIEMPFLKERKEDIKALYEYFIRKHNQALGKHFLNILRPDVQRMLEDYAWPRNIRQLGNAIEAAMNRSDSCILLKGDFPEEIRSVKSDKNEMYCNIDEIADQLLKGEYTYKNVKELAPPHFLGQILERTCVKYYEVNKDLTEDQLVEVLGYNTRGNVHRELAAYNLSTRAIKKRLKKS